MNELRLWYNLHHPFMEHRKPNAQNGPDDSTSGRRPESNVAATTGDEPELCLPTQVDVKLGRGKSNLNHPGNKYFHGLIECNRDRYFHVTTTTDGKRAIVMDILRFMNQTNRRFLKEKRDGNNITWTRLSNKAARQKVAHALQYKQRCSFSKAERSPVIHNDREHGPTTRSIRAPKSVPEGLLLDRTGMPVAADHTTSRDNDDDAATIHSFDVTKSLVLSPSADFDATDWWCKEGEEQPMQSPTVARVELTWDDMGQFESPEPWVDTKPPAVPVFHSVPSVPLFPGESLGRPLPTSEMRPPIATALLLQTNSLDSQRPHSPFDSERPGSLNEQHDSPV